MNLFVGQFRQRRNRFLGRTLSIIPKHVRASTFFILEDRFDTFRMVLGASPENNRDENNENEQNGEDNKMETETVEVAEESDKKVASNHTQVETHAVIEHNPGTSQANASQNENVEILISSKLYFNFVFCRCLIRIRMFRIAVAIWKTKI